MSTQVRLHPVTKTLLDERITKINAAREKAGLKKMTMDDVVFKAIKEMDVKGAQK
jgi:hypothetical protein